MIYVDYYNLASHGCYTQGIQNSPIVAECVAQLVDEILSNRNDTAMKQFHFIGFSLGGQVCGQISNYRKSPDTYSRITGIEGDHNDYGEHQDNILSEIYFIRTGSCNSGFLWSVFHAAMGTRFE